MEKRRESGESATGLEAFAFEALVGEHAASLYRLARSLVRDPASREQRIGGGG